MSWLIWASLLYIAGFIHGRFLRRPEEASVTLFRRAWGWLRGHGFDNVSVILSIGLILTGFAWWHTSKEFGNFVDCQASYNQASAEATSPRAAASETWTNSLLTFAVSLGSAAGGQQTPDERRDTRQAFAAFVTASQNLQTVRDENPLPPLPDDFCK